MLRSGYRLAARSWKEQPTWPTTRLDRCTATPRAAALNVSCQFRVPWA